MSVKLKIDASVITSKGNIRSKNEDNFYLNGLFMEKHDNNDYFSYSINNVGQEFIFAVCDGMGGEEFGEEASFLAVKTLNEVHKLSATNMFRKSNDLIGLMDSYIKRSNSLIYEQSLALGKRMGTTLASVLFCEDKAIALNIGDSRVYLLHDSNLTKLTTDHTEAERLIRLGLLNKDNARFHNSKNILTRHLGADPATGMMEADYSNELNVSKGDTYLICSDGLSNALSNEELKFSLSIPDNSSVICKNLVDLAINNDSTDNVTALIVRIIDII